MGLSTSGYLVLGGQSACYIDVNAGTNDATISKSTKSCFIIFLNSELRPAAGAEIVGNFPVWESGVVSNKFVMHFYEYGDPEWAKIRGLCFYDFV